MPQEARELICMITRGPIMSFLRLALRLQMAGLQPD